MDEHERFSVRVYYDDGERRTVRRFVSAKEIAGRSSTIPAALVHTWV